MKNVFIMILSLLLICHIYAYKIVGLVPARNEEDIIAQCLKCLSCYTDAIVFLDDASTDRTAGVVESIAKECHVEKIIKKEKWYRDEPGDRNKLLNAGREIGGTHFIVIDADEVLTSNFLENNLLKKKILSLKKGEMFLLKWIQLWRSVDSFRDDDSVWSKGFVNCMFCDDGVCSYSSQFIHTPRSPNNLKGRKIHIKGKDLGLMHFQFVNWENLLIKQAWYRCLELIRFTKKSPHQINLKYKASKDEKKIKVSPVKNEWFSGYSNFDKGVYLLPEKWRRKQILNWFNLYGKDFFKDLDIWDVSW